MGGAVGKLLGTAGSIALGTNPFLAAGSTLGTTALENVFSGGSSSPNAQAGYDYGTNTYTVGNKPFNASNYFITGDKGVYNLMPELGNLYGNNTTNTLPGSTSSNVYNSIYNKMEGDPTAQAALAKAYGPQTFTFAPTTNRPGMNTGFNRAIRNFNGPSYLRNDIRDAYSEQKNAYQLANRGIPGKTRPAFTPTPIQYSNFGFGQNANTVDKPLNALADYAAAQKNPFFAPFAPTTPTPPAPVNTTPAPAPAPVETPAAPVQAAPTPGDFVPMARGGIATLRRY